MYFFNYIINEIIWDRKIILVIYLIEKLESLMFRKGEVFKIVVKKNICMKFEKESCCWFLIVCCLGKFCWRMRIYIEK